MITKEDAKVELAKRELARRRLGDFIEYHNEDYKKNWHHALIIQKLEAVLAGKIRKLAIFVPPQNGKSEIASVNFPAFFFGKRPEGAVIAASYNSDLAVRFGRRARNLVGSQDYQTLFPGVHLAEDTKAAGVWNTNKGGEYTAVGMGGGTTGRRADIIIIDDPVKDMQEAESPVVQERNYEWYRSVALTRLSPTGAVVLIQTRWHDQDLAGMILENEDDWDIVDLPAIAEEDEEYRMKGDPLWPARYPLEWLERTKKDLGLTIWSALYQQQPLSGESSTFQKNMFRYRTIEEITRMETRCFVTFDPAPGKTEDADSIGVCINFVDRENFWNLVAYRIKFNAKELINHIFKLQGDYNVESFGIEQGMYKDVLNPFLEEEMRRRERFPRIVELKHEQRAKHLRIKGLQPRYEAKGIFHIQGLCGDLEEELLRFPKGKHDDVADATAYQSQIAEKPYGVQEENRIHENRRARTDARADAGL